MATAVKTRPRDTVAETRRAETVAETVAERIVEIVSDSGEGAQRCGQSLGAIAARAQVRFVFARKDPKVIDANLDLLDAGRAWAAANLDLKFSIPATRVDDGDPACRGRCPARRPLDRPSHQG